MSGPAAVGLWAAGRREGLVSDDGNGCDPARAAGHPAPLTLGIVFALEIEADAFSRLVTRSVSLRTAGGLAIHTGLIGGRSVGWVVGGVGAEQAARAAALLIEGHRPRLLASAGFAGGLQPGYPRGALVVVTRALRRGAATPELADPALSAAPRATIVTVDDPVSTPTDKRALAESTAAELVDMETHAVAGVARSMGLPCVGLRVVSDAVDDRLPPEVMRLSRPQSGWRRLGAAMGAVGRRPGAAIDLWRLWERAVVDGRRLADGLASLARTIPPV